MQKRTRMYVCTTYVHPCSFLHLKPLIYWHIYPLKWFFCTTFLQHWVAFHWIPSQIIWFHSIQIDRIRPRYFGKCCAFKSQPSSLIRSFPFDSSTDCPGAMLTPSLHHHHAFWDSLTPPLQNTHNIRINFQPSLHLTCTDPPISSYPSPDEKINLFQLQCCISSERAAKGCKDETDPRQFLTEEFRCHLSERPVVQNSAFAHLSAECSFSPAVCWRIAQCLCLHKCTDPPLSQNPNCISVCCSLLQCIQCISM